MGTDTNAGDIAARVAEEVAEVTAEIVEEENAAVEVADQMNKALVAGMVADERMQAISDVETRLNSRIDDIITEVTRWQTQSAEMQASLNRLEALATANLAMELQETAEAPSTLEPSPPQNDVVDVEAAPVESQPETSPPPSQQRKRRGRLL